jgi:hypothetical protein
MHPDTESRRRPRLDAVRNGLLWFGLIVLAIIPIPWW